MNSHPKWSLADAPLQTARTAIVTGANTGLGFVTARGLASLGASVIMACRDEAKARAAMRRITDEFPTARCQTMHLDLADLSSVENFANQFRARRQPLDLLINNAGVMMPPYTTTSDGFELQFGVNHLGHFALTGRLLDLLIEARKSRVVTVSSNAHRAGNLDFDDLAWSARRYRRLRAYGDSKLANLAFTYELDRRLRAGGIPLIAVAAHPGFANTELLRFMPGLFRPAGWLGTSAKMGALPQLLAATAKQVEGGQYFGPGSRGELYGYPKLVRSSRRSYDEDMAARLWAVSERLTGVRYTV